MDEAFPGDIVGLVNPGEFRLGDTLCQGPALNFEPLPEFAPEHFARLRCPDTSRRKQFDKGLKQLIEEGAIQTFLRPGAGKTEMILAAVGELQLDVLRFRLESEYGARTTLERLPFKLVRWIQGGTSGEPRLRLPYSAKEVRDRHGRWAVLFGSEWDVQHSGRENPDIQFSEVVAHHFRSEASTNELMPA